MEIGLLYLPLYMKQTHRMRLRYKKFSMDSIDSTMVLSLDVVCIRQLTVLPYAVKEIAGCLFTIQQGDGLDLICKMKSVALE